MNLLQCRVVIFVGLSPDSLPSYTLSWSLDLDFDAADQKQHFPRTLISTTRCTSRSAAYAMPNRSTATVFCLCTSAARYQRPKMSPPSIAAGLSGDVPHKVPRDEPDSELQWASVAEQPLLQRGKPCPHGAAQNRQR